MYQLLKERAENQNKILYMNEPFFVPDFSYDEVGRLSTFSIPCKVKGYWSRDSIYIQCDRTYVGAPKWTAFINYASGGRDRKDVESDSEACRYFAQALNYMCDLADDIINNHSHDLERNYQANIEAERQRVDRYLKEQKEAEESDTPLGEDGARQLINSMLNAENAIADVYVRGAKESDRLELIKRNKSVFYLNGFRASKNKLISLLSNYSNRSAIVQT